MTRKPSSWRKRAVARIGRRDGFKCAICGVDDYNIVRRGGLCGSFANGNYYQIVYITSCLELEHTTPLSEGGSNDDNNLKLVCHACHKLKTSKEKSNRLKALFAEWRASQ